MSLLTSKMVVDTLRVRGAPADTPALRLDLSSLLQSAEVRPPGLPPAAILLVRHLSHPASGRMALRRSTTHIEPAWQEAVRNRLGDLARQAVRPNHGHVPLAAEVVLFASQGELLACLAVDFRRGRALDCWWWRMILRLLGSVDLPTLLQHQARLVPAMVAHWADWETEAEIAAAIPPPTARALLQRVLRAHHVDWSPAATFTAPEPLEPAPHNAWLDQAAAPGTQHPGPPPALGVEAVPALPPWADADTLASAVAALAPEQQCLLGVTLLLHRSPTRVRSRSFLRALAHWWCETVEKPVPQQRPQRPPPLDVVFGESPAQVSDVWSVAAPVDTAAASERESAEGPASSPKPVDRRQDPAVQPPIAAAAARADTSAAQTQKREMAAAPDAVAAPSPAYDPTPTNWHEFRGTPTHLGGLLFLLNLFEHLDLPACFQAGWALPEQVGLWGLLEGVGRALLASDAGQRWPNDPIWPALAQLDRRQPCERPGSAFSADLDFRLPPTWVQQIHRVLWTVQGGRLYLWTGDPFLIADVTCTGDDASAQASREASVYMAEPLLAHADAPPPLASLSSDWFGTCSEGYRRWMAAAVPYLSIWLHRALHIPAGETNALVETLLHRPGTLYITATHVDLILSLEQISLPVRLAGLDRSPGWLPNAGRVITLHFE